MFNLKYLPVAGIMRRYSKNKIPHLIARGVEWLLLKNTAESYSFRHEKDLRTYSSAKYKTPLYEFLGEPKFNYKIEKIFDFKTGDSVTAIENMTLVGDVLDGELSNALDEFEELIKSGSEGFYRSDFRNEDDRIRYRAGLLRRMLNWIVEKFEALVNYIKWFVFMTNREEDIYEYITGRDEKEVGLFLHLMMDVDHFFNESTTHLKYRSRFDFEKVQIDYMQRLNTNHDNLIGFVAFNPARDNCMEIIKKAIEKQGFKGVKFYPPLGYQADHDEKYSAQIEALLDYCTSNKVPLFTHCNNQGFEAWPKPVHSGYHSNPKFWEAALEKHQDLILCLGHAGGSQGWFCENKDSDKTDADTINAGDIMDETGSQKDWNRSYASMVFKLCVKYKNVYCDASYLDDMVNKDGSFVPGPKTNFKDRLLKLFTSTPKFAKKIMYGSDWHMLFQDGINNVYFKNYKAFFEEEELKPYRDDFFYNNACKYLNLNAIS